MSVPAAPERGSSAPSLTLDPRHLPWRGPAGPGRGTSFPPLGAQCCTLFLLPPSAPAPTPNRLLHRTGPCPLPSFRPESWLSVWKGGPSCREGPCQLVTIHPVRAATRGGALLASESHAHSHTHTHAHTRVPHSSMNLTHTYTNHTQSHESHTHPQVTHTHTGITHTHPQVARTLIRITHTYTPKRARSLLC